VVASGNTVATTPRLTSSSNALIEFASIAMFCGTPQLVK
jgi:hypothetical protein